MPKHISLLVSERDKLTPSFTLTNRFLYNKDMKLISINIENNLHTETVLNFLKKEQADVVCLQELLEEDFDFYKKELNLGGVFQAWSYVKSPLYTNIIGKKQGVGIFAKNIIESGSIFYFGEKNNIEKSFDE